jgi:MarR family transcriptional repressor of emrRAB
MNSPLHYDQLAANIGRMHARLPDSPQSCVLLSRLFLHLGRGMSSMLEQQIKPFGLAEAEFRVLATLFSQPGAEAHPSELCLRTSQSAANMSRISDSLVARHLITRDSSLQDRRKMVLRMTDSGDQLVRELLPKLFAPLRDLFADLSEPDRRQLIEHLKLLCSRLDAALSHPGQDRGE